MPPPSALKFKSHNPLLINLYKNSQTPPTTLVRILILSTSFDTPQIPLGVEASRHHQRQWSFTGCASPDGLQPITGWTPLILPEQTSRRLRSLLQFLSVSRLPATIRYSEFSLPAHLPTGSNKFLVGQPWFYPNRRPGAWGLSLPDLCCW